MPSRRPAFVVLLTLAALPLTAQQPAASPAPVQSQAPASSAPVLTLRTTLRQVVLDVVVNDKNGHAVKGLKASDFQLTEDGAPQTLVNFGEQIASASPSPAPEPTLPPNTFINHAPITGNGAITVILFDELSFVDTAYVRYEVSNFIKTLTPGMPICVFKLDWKGLHLVQDFTTDPRTLREAVNSKRNDATVFHPPGMWQPNLLGDAMNQLARYLSGFSGRKNLIWFTDGLPPELGVGRPGGLFPDVTSFFDDPSGAVDVLTLSRTALYPIDARGLVVNAKRGFEILSEDGALAQAADSTGGHAFYSTNGFKQAVAEVVADGSNYYTLAYNPTNTNWNGEYRKIKLKLVNNAWPDGSTQSAPTSIAWPFSMEYRQGYYARPDRPIGPARQTQAASRKMISYSPKGDPNPAAHAAPMHLAMGFGAVAPFQILFQAQVTPAPATQKIKHGQERPKGNFLEDNWQHSPYRNFQIHYSINAHDLQLDQNSAESYTDTLELIAVVYNDDGAIVNSLVSTIPMVLRTDEYLKAINNGMGALQTIAIPSHGDYFLRLGVHDLNSGHIGALEIPAESIKLTAQGPGAKP